MVSHGLKVVHDFVHPQYCLKTILFCVVRNQASGSLGSLLFLVGLGVGFPFNPQVQLSAGDLRTAQLYKSLRQMMVVVSTDFGLGVGIVFGTAHLSLVAVLAIFEQVYRYPYRPFIRVCLNNLIDRERKRGCSLQLVGASRYLSRPS